MIPKIVLIKDENNEMTLRIENCRVSVMNSLRRVLLSEIPMLAFDQICIERNTGIMNEDMLAHRISMIPLCCPQIDYMNFQEDCACVSGCKRCEINYHLEIKNNEEEDIGVFCMNLIRDHQESNDREESKKIKCTTTSNGILLARLQKNQEIKLNAKAIKGKGELHKKWSAINVCYFERETENSFLFHIEVNDNVRCIDIMKKAIKILHDKFIILEKKIHLYHNECEKDEYGSPFYHLPYDDTILNILVDYLIDNYNPPICFYQRGHFLNEPESKLVVFDDQKTFSFEETDNLIRICINMIESTICFMESSMNDIQWGLCVSKK